MKKFRTWSIASMPDTPCSGFQVLGRYMHPSFLPPWQVKLRFSHIPLFSFPNKALLFKTLINTLLFNNKKLTLSGSMPVFHLVDLSPISFFELLCSEAFQKKHLNKSLPQHNDATSLKGRQAASAPGHQHCSKPHAPL